MVRSKSTGNPAKTCAPRGHIMVCAHTPNLPRDLKLNEPTFTSGLEMNAIYRNPIHHGYNVRRSASTAARAEGG
jgi:hypothetical protein